MQRSSREASITSQTDNVPSAHETVTSVANSLDELTDAELVKTVEDLQVEAVHLDLENQVFENFLQKNDPALIVGMGLILDLAIKMQLQSQTQSTLAPPLERRDTGESARGSSRRTDSVVKFATTASMSERGPRINVSQKMDLAMREMEEMQVALEEFIKVSHKSKCNLKAELEEIGIREMEVNEARDIFEHKIVTEGVDLLTQRIPAEKFIRYMDEWLKSAESTIEKMRLRTSTLKAMFTKVTHQLIQKEELGEAIDAVDFDQLRIENQHLAEKIEQKNTHLLELKRMNGMANLVLTTNKQYLQKQVQELQSIKDSIKRKEERIVQLDKESEDVEKEVIKVKDKYEKIVNTAASYRVPDTMEYLKTRAKLADLKKNVKIFERKNHILHFALSTCVRQMKNLTGIKTPHSSWFEFKDLPSENSFSSLDDKMCVEGKASISS